MLLKVSICSMAGSVIFFEVGKNPGSFSEGDETSIQGNEVGESNAAWYAHESFDAEPGS